MISQQILFLQDNQIIKEYYTKWWKKMYINDTCETEKKETSAALSIENVGGVFVVLIGGVCIAIVIAVFEFIYFAWTKRDFPVYLFLSIQIWKKNGLYLFDWPTGSSEIF